MTYTRWVKLAFSLASAALILCGVSLLIWPGVSARAICTVVGWLGLIHGITRLAGYFSNDLYRLAFQFDLAVGVLSIIVGGILIRHTENVLALLPIVIGLFILVDSALRIQTAIDAKHFGMEKWWLILLVAAAGTVLGAALMVHPSAGGRTLTRLIGLSLIMHGGENMLACLYTVRVPRRSSAEDFIEAEFDVEDAGQQ